MTDQKHGDIHAWRAAERRDQQQRSFSHAPLAPFSGELIVNGDEYRNNINDDQIY